MSRHPRTGRAATRSRSPSSSPPSPARPLAEGDGRWPLWTLLAIAAPFLPLLVVHARLLWARPHYQVFPLIVPGAAALAWRACRRLGPLEPGSRGLAMLLGSLSWIALVTAVAFISPGAAVVAALITALASAQALGGATLVVAMLPAWIFLGLLVPLPRRLDAQLIGALQHVVSRLASRFLDTAHVDHVMRGNIVELAGRQLLVDQACSGIYSLLTLLIGTLFHALWSRLSARRTLFLLLAAVFWVIMGNVARIVAVVLLDVRHGIDASTGWKHELLGMIVFLLMIALLASTDALYGFYAGAFRMVFGGLGSSSPRKLTSRNSAAREAASQAAVANAQAAPLEPEPAAPVELGPTRFLDLRAAWPARVGPALAFGLVLLPQILVAPIDWRRILRANDLYAAPFAKLDADTLPPHWRSFDRAGYRVEDRAMDDSWGEHSHAWSFADETHGASVSVDHQFVDWHDLSACYIGHGWTVTGEQVGARALDGKAGPGHLVVIDMVNPQGWHGHLIYGLYDREGRPVAPPASRGLLESLMPHLAVWARPSTRDRLALAQLNHQIQLFIEGDAPLAPAEREQALAFHEMARAAIHQKGLNLPEPTR